MIKKNDNSLSELLKVFVQNKRMKPQLYQKKIEQGWHELMGPWVRQETRSIKLRGRKLFIEIISAPLRQELHYAKDSILEKVNELLEEEYITEVIIR